MHFGHRCARESVPPLPKVGEEGSTFLGLVTSLMRYSENRKYPTSELKQRLNPPTDVCHQMNSPRLVSSGALILVSQ